MFFYCEFRLQATTTSCAVSGRLPKHLSIRLPTIAQPPQKWIKSDGLLLSVAFVSITLQCQNLLSFQVSSFFQYLMVRAKIYLTPTAQSKAWSLLKALWEECPTLRTVVMMILVIMWFPEARYGIPREWSSTQEEPIYFHAHQMLRVSPDLTVVAACSLLGEWANFSCCDTVL